MPQKIIAICYVFFTTIPLVWPIDNMAKDQLVAWCIVPFDAKQRGPAERAEMLKRLGLKRVAYDWRERHVKEFEEEILQYKKHGLEFFAFWSAHEEAFSLFAKHRIHPQVWVTAPSPNAESHEARVIAAAQALAPLVKCTRQLGCKLGLYNHGNWGGKPAIASACGDIQTTGMWASFTTCTTATATSANSNSHST